MALGVWHFAAKSHIDVKRVYSQFGNIPSVLKVGTAGTAIQLDDCKPGAFDLQSHLARVAEKKQTTMTVETLRADVDWTHVHAIQSLYWVRVLVDYIPELKAPHARRLKNCGAAAGNQRRAGDRDSRDGVSSHALRESTVKWALGCLGPASGVVEPSLSRHNRMEIRQDVEYQV
ncbi:hypothetical protein K443DRAFT_6346 [Laccaria amethystina LaAM-08-1]|uniref:Unplaced genomic scaffold K443scaffold_61, whole genome shotgun sequence n=1 Tax=Laccaria amethystina LaAM-08-1 TaxID=1095629 RepID=A0A0C9XWZ1_9AGAR|nr:hypothetical protein K443DRAFT_6346 [Laccaria amethystina LaAM-08-1]